MSKMQNKFTIGVIAAAALALASGCEKKEFATKTFFTADTYFSVTLPQDKESLAETAFAGAEKNEAEGRGAAADKAGAFLKENGVKNFIVNFGGNISVSGKKNDKPFIAGIPNPKNPNGIISAIGLKKGGLATYPEAGKEGSGFYASVSAAAENAEQAEKLAETYYGMAQDEISSACAEKGGPVLIVEKDGKTVKLCGWEQAEVK